MRLGAPRLSVLEILGRAQDAQRHHKIKFSLAAKPTQDLFQAFDTLIDVGVLAKVGGLGPAHGHGGVRRYECTLRYLEGASLVSLKAVPRRACTYAELSRRARLGTGVAFLL